MNNNEKQRKKRKSKEIKGPEAVLGVVAPLGKKRVALGVTFLHALQEEKNKNMLSLLRPFPSSANSKRCGLTRSIARPKPLARYSHNARGFSFGFIVLGSGLRVLAFQVTGLRVHCFQSGRGRHSLLTPPSINWRGWLLFVRSVHIKKSCNQTTHTLDLNPLRRSGFLMFGSWTSPTSVPPETVLKFVFHIRTYPRNHEHIWGQRREKKAQHPPWTTPNASEEHISAETRPKLARETRCTPRWNRFPKLNFTVFSSSYIEW